MLTLSGFSPVFTKAPDGAPLSYRIYIPIQNDQNVQIKIIHLDTGTEVQIIPTRFERGTMVLDGKSEKPYYLFTYARNGRGAYRIEVTHEEQKISKEIYIVGGKDCNTPPVRQGPDPVFTFDISSNPKYVIPANHNYYILRDAEIFAFDQQLNQGDFLSWEGSPRFHDIEIVPRSQLGGLSSDALVGEYMLETVTRTIYEDMRIFASYTDPRRN